MQIFFGVLLILVLSAFFVFQLIALIRTFFDIARRNKVKSKQEVEKNADANCNDSNGDTIVDN